MCWGKLHQKALEKTSELQSDGVTVPVNIFLEVDNSKDN